MAINVSIQDRGADYLARGLESFGAGVAGGMMERRDRKMDASRYLSQSEDPTTAAMGQQGLKDFAGITPDIESRYLADEIDSMVASGNLTPEEARKAYEGNLAKMRQAVSQGATNRYLQQKQQEMELTERFRASAQAREDASYYDRAIAKARADAEAMKITGRAKGELEEEGYKKSRSRLGDAIEDEGMKIKATETLTREIEAEDRKRRYDEVIKPLVDAKKITKEEGQLMSRMSDADLSKMAFGLMSGPQDEALPETGYDPNSGAYFVKPNGWDIIPNSSLPERQAPANIPGQGFNMGPASLGVPRSKAGALMDQLRGNIQPQKR